MRIFNYNFEFYRVRKHNGGGISGFLGGDRSFRPFADADVLSVLSMISNRLYNVVFKYERNNITMARLAAKLHENCAAIVQHLFFEGSVSYDIINGCFTFENVERLHNVEEKNIVAIVDDVFFNTGKTKAETLRPYIDLLNCVNDSDLNLIMNYGAMGVVSPENSSRADGYLDDKEVERIEGDYYKKFGARFGKWALMITRNPVKYQKIDLPIAELQLGERRKTAIAAILQFLDVPKELHSLFENAKYANRNEAELEFYGSTISRYAELCCELLRKVWNTISFSKNDVWFDFVNVPSLQSAKHREMLAANEELEVLKKLKEEIPDRAEEIDKRINDLFDRL